MQNEKEAQYAVVPKWESTSNLHFCMNLLIDQVMVGLIELKLVASCDN